MVANLKYRPIFDLNGRQLYLFKVARGILQPEEAIEIANKAEGCLRGGDYVPDIILMEGEPNDDPNLYGPAELVSYIRSILSTFEDCAWHVAVLD
jgi:hypothetical protein